MTCTFTKYGHYISEKFLEDIYPIIDLLLTNLLPELIIGICVLIMFCMRKLVTQKFIYLSTNSISSKKNENKKQMP